jgi:hypothetical protein
MKRAASAFLATALMAGAWCSPACAQGRRAQSVAREFKDELRAKEAQGYDVSEARRLGEAARDALQAGDRRRAKELMDEAFQALDRTSLEAKNAPGETGPPASPASRSSSVGEGSNPFGVHVSNFRAEEPNELGADNRLIVRASQSGTKGSGLERVDQVLLKSENGVVVTLVADGKRPEGSHDYCLLQGSSLDPWKAQVSNLVERYDGDDDYGCALGGTRDCYAQGDGLYPSAKLQEAIRRRPVKYWQIENEWLGQLLDCSRGSESVTGAQYAAHLKGMAEVIRRKDPTAKIIFGAVTNIKWLAARDGDYEGPVAFGYTDCLYRAYRQVPKRGGDKRLERLQAIEGSLKEALRLAAPHYDVIDFHFYENNPRNIAHEANWLRKQLRDLGVPEKPLWSMENAGPYYFFLETGDAKPGSCKRSGPDRLPYRDDILAGQVVKHYAVGMAAGVEKIFWSTVFPTPSWSDNFIRTALVGLNGNKKPAYYAYRLMTRKLAGARKASEVAEGIYEFAFEKRPSVYVAWANSEKKNADLSRYLGSAKARMTRLPTSEGQTEGARDLVSTTAVPLSRIPVFLERED